MFNDDDEDPKFERVFELVNQLLGTKTPAEANELLATISDEDKGGIVVVMEKMAGYAKRLDGMLTAFIVSQKLAAAVTRMNAEAEQSHAQRAIEELIGEHVVDES